jgi:hypothetical protein
MLLALPASWVADLLMVRFPVCCSSSQSSTKKPERKRFALKLIGMVVRFLSV